MNRTLNVVRMQLVNRQTYLWVPLIVLGGSLVISLSIYGILAGAGLEGPFYGAGVQAPLWYFAVIGAQALTLTFPFSQAMSVTRREFFFGTLLTSGLAAALLGVVVVLGGLLEQATNGWGLQGYFFYIPFLWDSGPAAVVLFFFAIAMLSFVVGFWGATIYKRAGTAVLTIVILAITFLLVGLVWLITRVGGWMQVGAWFAQQGTVGVTLWGLVLIAALAGTSYLTLRRAVP